MGLKDWIKRKAEEVAEEDKERKMRLERDIIMALRQVYDPEIPVNVYKGLHLYGGKLVYPQETLMLRLTMPNA